MSAPFVVQPRPDAVARTDAREPIPPGVRRAAALPGEIPLPARLPTAWLPEQREPDARPSRMAAPAAVPVPRHPVLLPLAPYLDDGAVTDLFINGSAGLFVDRGSGAQAAPEWRATEDDVRDLAVALIGAGGRHIDD